jgi:hypothetical protein
MRLFLALDSQSALHQVYFSLLLIYKNILKFYKYIFINIFASSKQSNEAIQRSTVAYIK